MQGKKQAEFFSLHSVQIAEFLRKSQGLWEMYEGQGLLKSVQNKKYHLSNDQFYAQYMDNRNTTHCTAYIN